MLNKLFKISIFSILLCISIEFPLFKKVQFSIFAFPDLIESAPSGYSVILYPTKAAYSKLQNLKLANPASSGK